MQNSAVREYAARRGWAIAMKFREVGSGWAARSPCQGTGGSTPPGDRRGARIIVRARRFLRPLWRSARAKSVGELRNSEDPLVAVPVPFVFRDASQ
ncbi:MAG: hypothetical protein ABSF46_04205 [Terriglobia bacterium]